MGVGIKLTMATMPSSSSTSTENLSMFTEEHNVMHKKWLTKHNEMKFKKDSRCRRRASLDVVKEKSTVEEAVMFANPQRRRTSLPTILAASKKKAAMSSILVDVATLLEIQFLVDELSKNPSNVVVLAKKLKDLLHPYNKHVWFPKNSDPLSDDEPLRVIRPPTAKRTTLRYDAQSGRFSTTTTATGLPKEEPGPTKAKRLPKISKEKPTPMGSPIGSRCSSPVGESNYSRQMGRRQTFPNISLSQPQKLSCSVPNHSFHKKISTISSDYESDEPCATVVPSHASLARSQSVMDQHETYHIDATSPSTNDPSQEFYPHKGSFPETESSIPDEQHSSYSRRGSEQLEEGHLLFENYQINLLENVYSWNFPIFELAEKTDCVLSQMAFKLFQNTGLFETFQIPKNKFVAFMKRLENGYREIPYHNKIHAADVLHGCWYLSTQEIPGTHDNIPLLSSDSSDSDSGTSTVNPRQVNNIGHGSLAQAIPALELLALYLAAAMHDYDHPGKTNAFLVETRHPLATFYNDRSVLENHHASASWNLLYSDEKHNFLENLDTTEWKRLRFLIVEAILATDLKKHFDILDQFSNKTRQPLSCTNSLEDGEEENIRCGINWTADEDRLLVCQMVIKLADIGGPAKIKPLHVTWTKAICEEFFNQGDEERRLDVPVSPFMDRRKPQIAELQRTFINNLITPIVFTMHKNGILAGEIPEHHELYCLHGKTNDENLLVEQLKSNLNFWKTKTPYTGYDEMMEAFKFALPHRFSCSNFSQCKQDKNHRDTSADSRQPSNGTKKYNSMPADDDEVFDGVKNSHDITEE